ncbi:uncharacterized protein F5147DRAFT_569258 [Suillus discolor]|uniref:Alpha-type protein kinase domain-containing protein n=1 Tax=Suillus discolor TaxID=1912936 RepID=A0A9P7JY31_9AGAM|nr:uncharacterized protein F5147DRAFT_569258 [Suillus discolor]KAG2115279.1 hypothetical protein F5147DRAFT_569258 [Suillus discolor]
MLTQGLIGVGGFKTAHTGWLTLTAPPKTGLGSVAHHKVVVKRPFHKVFPTAANFGPYKIGQYSLADELPKLFRKANVLYWAKSLLMLTYDFIDHSIASSSEPPPFTVPCVHFVEAGLALCYHQGASRAGTKTGSMHAAFLLEELIKDGDEFFLKFIHNMDANPLLDELDYGYDFAEFFVFMQHVQYVKTRQLAFISDYQGMSDS